MRQYKVMLIGFDSPPQSADNLAWLLPRVWPGADESSPAKVTIEQTTLADLMLVGDSLPRRLYVIHIPTGRLSMEWYKFFDAISEQRLPAVLMVDHVEQATNRIGSEGFPICAMDEPVEKLAIRLHTLAERQITVDDLAGDLKLAQRHQGGLRSEIHRMEEELHLAATIQRDSLPKNIPEVDDVRFGVLFRPTGYVSGDIYDITRLDEHTVGFFLADAVGHGVPAALVTMVIMRSLHTKDINGNTYRIVPPSEVLDRLNQEMLQHRGLTGRFATAVYGTIDTQTHQVTLAVGGHPPPLLIHADGQAEPLEGTGGLLGVFPEEEYEETSFHLHPNERLLIYTDGFETAFPKSNADEFERRQPTERYLDTFGEVFQPGLTNEQVVQRLAENLDHQVGSLHQIDDLTALCLSLSPTASVLRGGLRASGL